MILEDMKTYPVLPLETGQYCRVNSSYRAIDIRVVDFGYAVTLSPPNQVVLYNSDLPQMLDITICSWIKRHVFRPHLNAGCQLMQDQPISRLHLDSCLIGHTSSPDSYSQTPVKSSLD